MDAPRAAISQLAPPACLATKIQQANTEAVCGFKFACHIFIDRERATSQSHAVSTARCQTMFTRQSPHSLLSAMVIIINRAVIRYRPLRGLGGGQGGSMQMPPLHA